MEDTLSSHRQPDRPTRTDLAAPQLLPWRKRCLLALAALLTSFSGASQSADWCLKKEVNINGISKHFYETKRSRASGWNELNSGLGLTCQLSGVGEWSDEIEAGFYSNSHFIHSVYAAYGIYYPLGHVLQVGFRLGGVSGYKTASSPSGISIGPMPTFKVKVNETFTLNLSLIPKKNSFLFVNLGIRF
jgi:hypothetical protein